MSQAIIQADKLEQFVDNAHTLVTEAKVHLNADEMRLAAVDPANVGMVDQSIAADAFESYGFDGGLIGINLDRLSDVLSMASGDDLVHLELDTETRKLEIEIGGLEYTLALIDPDSIRQEPDIPDIEEQLTGTFVGEAHDLQRARKAADLCSDHISFGADVDGELFYADAEGDTDDVRVTWDRDDCREGSSVDADAHSLFSLDYLKDMLSPINSSTETTLQIGEDVPLFLDTEFADGRGSVRYMLAPRIQS